jgi:hypothetical protein
MTPVMMRLAIGGLFVGGLFVGGFVGGGYDMMTLERYVSIITLIDDSMARYQVLSQ